MTDLFGDPNVGRAPEGHVALADARRLVERVYALQGEMEDFYDACERVRGEARRLSAHSVARAVCWLSSGLAFERYGFDHTHITAEKAADRWLRRLERSRW